MGAGGRHPNSSCIRAPFLRGSMRCHPKTVAQLALVAGVLFVIRGIGVFSRLHITRTELKRPRPAGHAVPEGPAALVAMSPRSSAASMAVAAAVATPPPPPPPPPPHVCDDGSHGCDQPLGRCRKEGVGYYCECADGYTCSDPHCRPHHHRCVNPPPPPPTLDAEAERKAAERSKA